MRQEMVGFWDGSGISWTICKQSAPRSRRITSTLSLNLFTGRMHFLSPNQSTEGKICTEPTTKKVEIEKN